MTLHMLLMAARPVWTASVDGMNGLAKGWRGATSSAPEMS